MRQRALAAAVLVFVLAALVLGAARGPVAADEQGTPAAGDVTTEFLGRHPSTAAPGLALALMRVTFAPGGGVTAHTHPGDTVYHLASGVLQFTLLAGEAQLVRATNGRPAAGTPSAAEPIPAGSEITLHTGDTIYYSASALQNERNESDVDAVVLVANLRGLAEPARVFEPSAASPVGTPPS